MKNKPEDTSKRSPSFHLLGVMTHGSSDYITGMEAAGQTELVNSESLPTDVSEKDRAIMERWGFCFGEPFKDDPLFMPASLPVGWRKIASDHDMWSYVVDELGRERVGVFYKAAFYDRKANMGLERRFDIKYVGDDISIVDRKNGKVVTTFLKEGGYKSTQKAYEFLENIEKYFGMSNVELWDLD